MNSISTASLSILRSPLSSSLVRGALSGVSCGTLTYGFGEIVRPNLSERTVLVGNAFLGTLPSLFFGDYLGALISIPVGLATVFSTLALRTPSSEGGCPKLMKPLALATIFSASIAKFLLGCSSVNALALGITFEAFMHILLSIYILVRTIIDI